MWHAGGGRRGFLREVWSALKAHDAAGELYLLRQVRPTSSARGWIRGNSGIDAVGDSIELCRAVELSVRMGVGNCRLLYGQAACGAIPRRAINYRVWRAYCWRIHFRANVEQTLSRISATNFFPGGLHQLRADLFRLSRIVDRFDDEIIRAQAVSCADCREYRRSDCRQISGVKLVFPKTEA